jgi:hypothetical protein
MVEQGKLSRSDRGWCGGLPTSGKRGSAVFAGPAVGADVGLVGGEALGGGRGGERSSILSVAIRWNI